MGSSPSSINEAMERPSLDPRHLPLQCPRCDSSNTKFCYYNNYSLSQPRHFCKACKRYWTRGGTLRNVPVGGGCRKNKRAKRQAPPSHAGGDGISSSNTSAATIQAADVDLSPTPNHVNNPLFYTLPANPLELNFPFSVSASVRVSSNSNRFDRQPQMNGYGVGFSSGNMAEDSIQNTDCGNAFRQIHQDVVISTTSAGNNPIFLGSPPALLSPTSTMASLLGSSFHQQRFASSGFQSLTPHEHMQMPRGDKVMWIDQEKIGGQNRLERNHNQIEQFINTSDSSSLLWNTANEGEWFYPPDVGSSVPSLI